MVDGIGVDNKLNGSHKSKSEISALTQWDAEDHIQKDAKESTSHESPVETTTAPASNNSTVADVSLLHTVRAVLLSGVVISCSLYISELLYLSTFLN